MDERVRSLLDDQAGVVARPQLIAAGLAPHDLQRMVRRRELVRLAPGVFVDHTGEPTWLQRAWAGVLTCWPAALAGESALRAVEGPGSLRRSALIHVAVDADRHVAGPVGVQVARLRGFDDRVQWNAGPPRQRYEDAVVDVAARAATDMLALDELARAVQGRRTTAERLRAVLAGKSRVARRDWLEAVLVDVASGACSLLEHGYLREERRHGISGGRRQVVDRLGAGTVYRDVEYDCGLVVELDGRLHHDTAAQRDRDFGRDLDLRVDGRDSVRLTYGQVYDRPCRTLGQIAKLLNARGWDGSARACGPGCGI